VQEQHGIGQSLDYHTRKIKCWLGKTDTTNRPQWFGNTGTLARGAPEQEFTSRAAAPRWQQLAMVREPLVVLVVLGVVLHRHRQTCLRQHERGKTEWRQKGAKTERNTDSRVWRAWS
jgi:hypothetical protein